MSTMSELTSLEANMDALTAAVRDLCMSEADLDWGTVENSTDLFLEVPQYRCIVIGVEGEDNDFVFSWTEHDWDADDEQWYDITSDGSATLAEAIDALKKWTCEDASVS